MDQIKYSFNKWLLSTFSNSGGCNYKICAIVSSLIFGLGWQGLKNLSCACLLKD